MKNIAIALLKTSGTATVAIIAAAGALGSSTELITAIKALKK